MKTWQKKERTDAKSFGGRPTPRSGGLWFAPGDVKTEDFLIDSKTTDKKSFSITGKIWRKIYKEALLSGKMPCLSIKLNQELLQNKEPIEVVVLSKDDFDRWFKERNEV